jgi:hypothetical protein
VWAEDSGLEEKGQIKVTVLKNAYHPLPAMIEILPAVGIITTQKGTTNTAGNDVIPGRIL